MTLQATTTSLALAASLLLAAPAFAVYKCEVPGRPPVYQDAPCPAGVAAKTIETDQDRDARLRAEALEDADKAKRDADALAKAAAQRRTAALDAETERWKRADAARDPIELEEARCAAGIRERMPALEPVGAYSHLGPGRDPGATRVRVSVRLSDSFRASPVGTVECLIGADGSTSVTKLRM